MDTASITTKYNSPIQKTHARWLIIISILVAIGCVFIYSSSSVFALEVHAKPHYFVIRQAIGLIIGIFGFLICKNIPLHIIKKSIPYMFWAILLLTCLTFFSPLSVTIHGSSRWLSIFGFSFQPSELLKIALLAYLAHIITKKRFSLYSFTYGYLPFLIILGLVDIVLLKQPDFGQAVTITAAAFLLLFIAKVQTKHLCATIIPLLPIVSLLIYLKPYRFKRILIFLDPWKDPKGAGFQIIQSLIAIGSGRFFGVGIGNSKQKCFYLPMQHTDFIFSIMAEETGFFGAVILITLYILFLYWGLKLARQFKDPFASYLTLGFVLLTSLQAFINIGVATSLLPTKGIGLPFVSFGSSALVCNLCIIGLISNCVKNYDNFENLSYDPI